MKINLHKINNETAFSSMNNSRNNFPRPQTTTRKNRENYASQNTSKYLTIHEFLLTLDKTSIEIKPRPASSLGFHSRIDNFDKTKPFLFRTRAMNNFVTSKPKSRQDLKKTKSVEFIRKNTIQYLNKKLNFIKLKPNNIILLPKHKRYTNNEKSDILISGTKCALTHRSKFLVSKIESSRILNLKTANSVSKLNPEIGSKKEIINRRTPSIKLKTPLITIRNKLFDFHPENYTMPINIKPKKQVFRQFKPKIKFIIYNNAKFS